MPAQAGGRKKRSASRAPSRARSVAAPTAAAEKKEAPAGEKGGAIEAALYKALDAEVGTYEKSKNKEGNYHRLRLNGKGFGYVFLPRASSVMVRIPQHLVDPEPKLRNAKGFKRTNYGIWRTLTASSEAREVAKFFKVAADAVRAKAEATS